MTFSHSPARDMVIGWLFFFSSEDRGWGGFGGDHLQGTGEAGTWNGMKRSVFRGEVVVVVV